jgi:hypothetical protein
MNIKAAFLLALTLLGSTTSTDSCAQGAASLLDSFKTWKPIIDALSATLVYHEYSTQRLDDDLGTEVNVQLQAKVRRFSGLIKYAAYEAHEGRTPAAYRDTTKLWVQLEYVW